MSSLDLTYLSSAQCHLIFLAPATLRHGLSNLSLLHTLCKLQATDQPSVIIHLKASLINKRTSQASTRFSPIVPAGICLVPVSSLHIPKMMCKTSLYVLFLVAVDLNRNLPIRHFLPVNRLHADM